jgi:subfamily B ATP-binding cassette protein MsbA
MSTIEYADRIILLKDGEIIEQGTHEEMMAMKGAYFTLQTLHGKTGADEVIT